LDIIIVMMLLFLAGAFLWQAVRAKELACRYGKQHCQQLQVQFLDDTVVQRSLRLVRNQRGSPVWQRTYSFEFATDGRYRYQGEIIVQGYQLLRITTEAHAIVEEQ
jgi:hypothetical protein